MCLVHWLTDPLHILVQCWQQWRIASRSCINRDHHNVFLQPTCSFLKWRVRCGGVTLTKGTQSHPGGMHTLMSFLGAIGHLMKGSGLEEILGAAFSGINSMLNGKAWPRAMRGFRMVTTALLQQYILAGTTEVANIEEELEMAHNTPTDRMWVDCFIIPTFVAHLFVRAEWEGDWLLHMYCLRRILPYFFASSHWNYARYIHWYIQNMDANLPPAINEQYLTDGHTCRHLAGVWNAVSEDQFGE